MKTTAFSGRATNASTMLTASPAGTNGGPGSGVPTPGASLFRAHLRRGTSGAFLLLAVIACVRADSPEAGWNTATPIEAGLDQAKLAQARDYALTGGGSGYILCGGKLVFSWGDPKQRYDLKSTTKSFGAAALGIALQEGKVRLSDKARAHHPAFGIPPGTNATEWLDEITLLHLASQTAGFDKPGGYVPLLFRPGTEWAYSDSGPNWLAECLTLAYGRDLDELMFERLFTPLGIERSDLVWRKNQYRPDLIEGIKRREFGAGISANVDAMARFGLLWLRRGEWNGRQILPREFVDQVRATVPGVLGLPVRKPEEYGRAASHYGLLWWNNADETIEGLPLDTYWSWGLYDSLIVIMPSLDIVVARAGKSWKRDPGADHYDVLKPFLLPIAASAKTRPRTITEPAQGAVPYPRSPVVERIEWAPREAIVRKARGSDNWPMTWADDGALYTAYGDGNGFEPFVQAKLSLGLARIEGTPPGIRGVNIRSGSAEALGDGLRGRKASGMLCVEGVLYLLVRNVGNAQLAWSADHGAAWTWADWKLTESFGCPTFLNFGKDYAGARDDFIYVYSPDHDSAYERADRFVMARAPKARLRERDSWEFFVRIDALTGQSVWSTKIVERGAVFTNPGACYRSGISYDAGLKRYLWCQTGLGEDTRFRGGFGIYDAPEPWGPWTTVFHAGTWDVGPGESSSFPTKWMSPDGRTLYLVFSGEDHFSVRQGTLVLAEKEKVGPPPLVFPGDQWEEATPGSQGVDGEKLEQAARWLGAKCGSDGVRELVVIRHGRMIWKGDNIDKRHGVWSATKSFTSTVLGLLVEDGKCTLDTPVADVLPELREHYPEVTLRHLTTMTSGYRAVGDETSGSYKHGPSNTPFKPNPQPLFTPPGAQYAYWDSAMNTLALALTKVAGEPIENLFRRRVAEPIQMKDWEWGDYATVDGVIVNGGSGNGDKHILITAREMARFGLLFLNKGNWNGRQLVSSGWVAEATRVHVPSSMPWAHPESDIDGRGAYGFNWWRNGTKPAGMKKLPGAPDGMFWAAGHNNNKCFVIPEWGMVVVRLGLDGQMKDEVWNEFFVKLREAVQVAAPGAGAALRED